jgi:hypothetical protein
MLCPDGFNVFHSPMMGRTGGGVAVLVRDTIDVSTFDSLDSTPKSFEHMVLSLTINAVCIRLIVVYCPPKSKPSLPFQCLMKELATYLECLSVSSGKVIIVGDFNLHIDNPDDSNVIRFVALLESLSWVQHVKGATHIRGHTLNLVISRSSDQLASESFISVLISDHFAVVTVVPPTSRANEVNLLQINFCYWVRQI